ncbi:hypothetical protein [Flavobacterium pedocola]
MKENEIHSLTDLHKYIGNRRYFTLLKPCEHRKESYNVPLQFSGHADVIFTVMDIIKVAILALEADEPYDSNHIVNSRINIRNLLEIALQLIPMEEMQLLDEIHQLHETYKKTETSTEITKQ